MAKCLLWLVLPPLLTKGSATPPFRKGRWVGASRAGGFESCRATPLRKGVSQLPLNPPSRLRRDTSLCEREVYYFSLQLDLPSCEREVFVMSASACRVLPSPFCEREVLQEDLINRCLIDLFDRLLQSLIKLFVALLGA